MYNSSIQDTAFPTLQFNDSIRSWQQKFFQINKKKKMSQSNVLCMYMRVIRYALWPCLIAGEYAAGMKQTGSRYNVPGYCSSCYHD